MSSPLSKWNDPFLRNMSQKGDAYAESLIADIVKGNDFKALQLLFTTLKNNREAIAKSTLPQSVIDYFNKETTLPPWADAKKIELAQNVYARFGPQVALVLNFKALPLCYACRNGAKVLASTGRLTGADKDVSRTMKRLFETSQMVINVMSPGGLSPQGDGIITVKKVRLYHASIRFFLTHPAYNPKGWDMSRNGLPINQEEMAGTLMAFSALVIRGLEELGARLTDGEKDAYIHCWEIVAHFIGIEPSIYPSSCKEGWDLGIAIINRNKEECEEGKLLISSLLDFSLSFFKGSRLDKILFSSMPVYLVQFFVSGVSAEVKTDMAALLGAGKKQGWFSKLKGRIFIGILRMVTKSEDRNPLIRKLFSRYSRRFLQGMVNKYLETYNVAFYIPDSLKESWNMK